MKKLMLFIAVLFAVQLSAQNAPAIEADTSDVNSIDQIIQAYYDVTNGPAGQRDWARYRSLFVPEAQINARVFNVQGKPQYVSGTLNEYIAQVDEYFTLNGFFEKEIGRATHHYRDIAQVFSSYDAKLATNQASYHRGIKSIQLVFDKDRWWIVNIMYNNESVKEPIPEEFLYEENRSKK